MYVSAARGGTTPELRAEMNRIVADDLLTALEAEPGYAGAMNLADATSGWTVTA